MNTMSHVSLASATGKPISIIIIIADNVIVSHFKEVSHKMVCICLLQITSAAIGPDSDEDALDHLHLHQVGCCYLLLLCQM